MAVKILIIIFLSLIVYSCTGNKDNRTMESQKNEKVVVVDSLYPIKKSSISITDIADTVFYVKLQRQMSNVYRIDYYENNFFVNHHLGVTCFNLKGEILFDIPVKFSSIDINPIEKLIYIYTFKNKTIYVYDFLGKLVEQIKVKTQFQNGYGYTFAQVNDSTYALSSVNLGYNKHELVFINNRGLTTNRIPNIEPFSPSSTARIYNSAWDKLLFNTPIGLLYHRYNSDTIFSINKNLELTPIFIDRKIKKIPLNCRLENVGGELEILIKSCLKHKWHHTRYYVNSRFFLCEYVIGKSPTQISNYMLYDKFGESLYVHEFQLSDYLTSNSLHIGINNDYDGGLAFNPTSQSGDYLIMYNANGQGGRFKSLPKTIYQTGRTLNGTLYNCKSDSSISKKYCENLKRFMKSFNENSQSMLTVIKLKSY